MLYFSLDKITDKPTKSAYFVSELPLMISSLYKLNFKKKMYFYDDKKELITFIN
jgi:hypothetical protein